MLYESVSYFFFVGHLRQITEEKYCYCGNKRRILCLKGANKVNFEKITIVQGL